MDGAVALARVVPATGKLGEVEEQEEDLGDRRDIGIVVGW